MSAALEVADPVRVGRPADRLVRGDRDVHGTTYGGQLLDARAGLLDVLQPARGAVQRPDRADRFVHVPAAVRVDPDLPVRTQRVADRLDPGDVVTEALAGLGDLDLGGGAATGEHDRVRPLGGHRRDGDVDRDRRPQRRRPVTGRSLLGAAQPGLGDLGVVLQERAPLAPAGLPPDQHALPDGDATEAGPHRDRPHGQRADARHASSRSRSRSGLPLVQHRQRVEQHHVPWRPRARMYRGHPRPGVVQREVADDERHHSLPPLLVRDSRAPRRRARQHARAAARRPPVPGR